MKTHISENITRVIDRLEKAGNQHNLPAFLECMALDYWSEPPNHPARAFRGRAQVEKNWSAMFEEIPDFVMELVDQAVNGNQVWAEWHWSGTRNNGAPFNWRGVTIFNVEGNEITAGRLYMEPVEESGLNIDVTMEQITKG
jgi:ketosteroid isomerase-like protein